MERLLRPARFKNTGVRQENLSIFYNPLTGNRNFSYSLPNTKAVTAQDGLLSVFAARMPH